MCYLSAPRLLSPPTGCFHVFPSSVLVHTLQAATLCTYLRVLYIDTGFIELWQPYKAGLDKHALIHTSTTLQVNEIKQHSRRNLVWSCMFCVNVVHSQIVTWWTIILHVSFTQNAGIKFNIRIYYAVFPHYLQVLWKYGIWISYLCSIKLRPDPWPGALPLDPAGGTAPVPQGPDPQHIAPQCLLFPLKPGGCLD